MVATKKKNVGRTSSFYYWVQTHLGKHDPINAWIGFSNDFINKTNPVRET